MNKITLALGSRTFWTVAVLVVANCVNANSHLFTPDTVVAINSVLGVVATIFHLNPSQDYTQ